MPTPSSLTSLSAQWQPRCLSSTATISITTRFHVQPQLAGFYKKTTVVLATMSFRLASWAQLSGGSLLSSPSWVLELPKCIPPRTTEHVGQGHLAPCLLVSHKLVSHQYAPAAAPSVATM